MTATADTLDYVAGIVTDWRNGRRPAGQALIAIETLLREACVRPDAEGRSFVEPAEIYGKPLG